MSGAVIHGDDDLHQRAAKHAALGEPSRLAIVDELAASDRSPSELSRRLDIPGNLLAHHLDVLGDAGLIERFTSSGDGRRKYVRLVPDALPVTCVPAGRLAPVLFVCTHNSARSQLAAALWRRWATTPADSAGTHPAERVHPGAVAAAQRHDLDLSGATPVLVAVDDLEPALDRLIITVCDQAHEELSPATDWLHWSIADPVRTASDSAFDDVVDQIEDRIRRLIATGSLPQHQPSQEIT
ncbi:MAG: helix-turn-helix domain-containing protein [Ilumatobacter sp.]|uniref:arsenate reductase/protein-tyrosine-phosphatase family protein n=1 Tax=Ilumatobacter sp. TaxID=1967498 RepID=UPI00391A580D